MIKDEVKRKNGEPKIINLNIKITKSLSDWLRKENLSPTAILNKACEELGYGKKIN